MSMTEFAALLTFAMAMSFTPGPNTTLAAALGANRGLRPALPFCFAVPAGWALLMLLSGAGAGAAMLAVPALRWVLKLAGVGYLLWLAWKLAGSATLAQADGRPMQVTFRQGVLLQFVNVKAWMLAIALAAGWVVVAGATAQQAGVRLAIVCGVMVVFAFTSNLLYAAVGAALRGWLAHGRRLLGFNRVMAALLVLTAVWMVQA
jgi:threonine/homoserine/homoserine lactone efflux protein